jgi:hypothetical protein
MAKKLVLSGMEQNRVSEITGLSLSELENLGED